MTVPSPTPFELTPDEAHQIQAEQSRRQTKFAQQGATFKALTLIVPVASLGLLIVLNRLIFDSAIPAAYYIGLIIAYLMGLFVQLIVMATTLRETKQRMLEATPQVWEQRDIELGAEGLVQTTPTVRSEFAWSAFKSTNRDADFLWFWLTDFNAVVIPTRAFASEADVDAFEAEVRQQMEMPDEPPAESQGSI